MSRSIPDQYVKKRMTARLISALAKMFRNKSKDPFAYERVPKAAAMS
jgi:hypothetical protein